MTTRLKDITKKVIDQKDEELENEQDDEENKKKEVDINQPSLIIEGLEGDIGPQIYELRKRGFSPKYSLQQGAVTSIVLDVSPKLHMKLAIQNGYPRENAQNSSPVDAARIVSKSRKIIQRSGLKYKSVWIMHQTKKVLSSLSSLYKKLYIFFDSH